MWLPGDLVGRTLTCIDVLATQWTASQELGRDVRRYGEALEVLKANFPNERSLGKKRFLAQWFPGVPFLAGVFLEAKNEIAKQMGKQIQNDTGMC